MNTQSDDRREHARRAAVLDVVLRVELHGYDTGKRRFEARGRTVNVSLGGLLALVDRRLEEGVRCLAHFPDAAGTLGRTMVFGSVRRCVPSQGAWEAAVHFDTPLVEIDLEDGSEP